MQNAPVGKAPNGSGSVWKRKDGRYGAKLTYPYHDPATGRTKKKTETTTKPDWAAAHRWLMEKQTDLLGGAVVSVEDPPLGNFLANWLRDVVDPRSPPTPPWSAATPSGTTSRPRWGT